MSRLGRVYAIALNTFREAIRNRVLYAIFVLVAGANLFAMVLGQMSVHEQSRVAIDVGIAAVSFCGAVTAIVLGVMLLYGEVQRRTIHTIVSKPIERYEFVIGKFAGMAFTLTLLVCAFALATVGLLALQRVSLGIALLKAIYLAYLEVMVVAAVAVFFSSFSSPILSGVFTFGIFFIGQVTPQLKAFIHHASVGPIRWFSEAMLFIVPDLHLFSVSGSTVNGKPVSVHGHFVSWAYVATATGYAAVYVVLLLVVAAAVFARRDFA